MNRIAILIAAAMIATVGLGGCRSRDHGNLRAVETTEAVIEDHLNFYAPRSATHLAAGLGLAAALAHTNADQDLADWWQGKVRSQGTDDLSRGFKRVGNGYYVSSAVVTAMVVGELWPEYQQTSVIGDWGYQSARALIVGAPPLLLLQNATGASRPGESSAESDWIPFADENGVSGHAFMGAVPFLTAAQMTDDPAWKALFYAGSTATALSRINDNDHYTSQAALGWWLAYLATGAVSTTEENESCYEIVPLAMADGMGIGLEIRH